MNSKGNTNKFLLNTYNYFSTIYKGHFFPLSGKWKNQLKHLQSNLSIDCCSHRAGVFNWTGVFSWRRNFYGKYRSLRWKVTLCRQNEKTARKRKIHAPSLLRIAATKRKNVSCLTPNLEVIKRFFAILKMVFCYLWEKYLLYW